MAVLNLQREWLYLFEPHTASRTTSIVLQSIGGKEIGGPHSKFNALTGYFPYNQDLDVCVTVRNPLDVLITRWLRNRGRRKPVTLREWAHIRKNTKGAEHSFTSPLIGLWKDATTFCWYEYLEADLQYVFQDSSIQLGYDDIHRTLETEDTFKQPWWTYFEDNKDVLDELLGLYKRFMKRFGYELDYVDGSPRMFINQAIRKKLMHVAYGCNPHKS
jgi:hypothetical protein